MPNIIRKRFQCARIKKNWLRMGFCDFIGGDVAKEQI